jgi:uncharacterized membrane protein YkoI
MLLISISPVKHERSKKMKKLIITLIATFALTTFAAIGVTAHAFTGQKYAKDAKINLAVARKTALKAFPGSIVSEELEREKGGSGLRYSFDIRMHGVTREVGVDALTGKVLEDSVEGPHPD